MVPSSLNWYLPENRKTKVRQRFNKFFVNVVAFVFLCFLVRALQLLLSHVRDCFGHRFFLIFLLPCAEVVEEVRRNIFEETQKKSKRSQLALKTLSLQPPADPVIVNKIAPSNSTTYFWKEHSS